MDFDLDVEGNENMSGVSGSLGWISRVLGKQHEQKNRSRNKYRIYVYIKKKNIKNLNLPGVTGM